MQSANDLKDQVGAKKADSTTTTITAQKNIIKQTFGKSFTLPLDFDFFKHPLYPYELKEDLIVGLELNSSEKVILRSGDTAAKYKLRDISLEHDAIFEQSYATKISEFLLEQHQFHIPR